MKYQPKSSHFALLAAACAGLCYLAFKYEMPILVLLLLVIIGTTCFFKSRNLLTLEVINKGTELALPSLDLMYGGLRFIGSQAKVVDTRRYWHGVLYNQEAHVTQLCITDSGVWFMLEFDVMERRPRPYGMRISALPNEAEVRAWLSTNYGAYRQYFGEPSVA